MNNRNIIIGGLVIVVLLVILAWNGGGFGSQETATDASQDSQTESTDSGTTSN